jgi:hypothetical protein
VDLENLKQREHLEDLEGLGLYLLDLEGLMVLENHLVLYLHLGYLEDLELLDHQLVKDLLGLYIL